MNYRHAFHAGNFADCMKHAVFVWLLRALARKPAGFFVLDTHAGIGGYDLDDGPAQRTGEWRGGIGRLLADPPPGLADYLTLVRDRGDGGRSYPGSPLLAAALLRPVDRLACCELHPEDHATLRARIGRLGDVARRIGVHHRDGYEAMRALLPPPERRALVLIDPPWEMPDEAGRLLAALRAAHARAPAAVFAAWFPVKHLAPVRALAADLRDAGLPDIAAAQLWLRAPLDPSRLNGCGLVVVNPPYRFDDEIPPILHALLHRLGSGEAGAAVSVERLVPERPPR